MQCFCEEEFRRPDAEQKYVTLLPDLPKVKRKNHMDREEEHQRFMEYAYARFVSDTKRADHLRNYIIIRNMPVLYKVAKQSSSFLQCNLQDCLSESHQAMMRAVAGFNPTSGTRFSTYFVPICRNALRTMKTTRTEKREKEKIWQRRKNASTITPSPLDDLLTSECFSTEKLFDSLDPRERSIVAMRFGFEGKKHSLKQIGSRIGYSSEYVRILQNQALDKLRLLVAA